jgi:hypothetical protein
MDDVFGNLSSRTHMLSRIPLSSNHVKLEEKMVDILLLPLGASINCYVSEIIHQATQQQKRDSEGIPGGYAAGEARDVGSYLWLPDISSIDQHLPSTTY